MSIQFNMTAKVLYLDKKEVQVYRDYIHHA